VSSHVSNQWLGAFREYIPTGFEVLRELKDCIVLLFVIASCSLVGKK
jgi:hypothetical protein